VTDPSRPAAARAAGADTSPPPGELRHNILTLGADLSLFLVGLSFASHSTILPAFVAHLGAPNIIIGAIPAVMTVGWSLPALFAAGHTEALPRKLPFVVRYSIWERAPFLVMAAVAFFLAGAAPALALVLVLAALLVITGMGGVLIPAWMDVVGRAIPTTLRGRFFAVSSLVGSGGGLLGSALTAYILAAIPAPASFGVCFLLSAVFMALSYAALLLVREPPAGAPRPAVPLGTYFRRLPLLLRQDHNLSWFLVARVFAILGMMAMGFFTVYALRVYQAATWQVGVFTALLLGGEMLGTLALGWLADRAGHRLVIMAGVAAMGAANVLALAAPSLEVFQIVFALAGVQMAAVHVSTLAILLEFAPTVEEQPTYVGLGNTLLAPVMFLSPLAAGTLADAAGFEPVFIVAAACALVGLGLLSARVRDPRHRAPAPIE
jgi:MFS family permease